MLTLYEYGICPYCVRVRMLFGLKNIPHQIVSVDYANVDLPTKMVGKKILPILEINENNQKNYMIESLDILDYLDHHYGKPIIAQSKKQKRLESLLKKYMVPFYSLLAPRYLKSNFLELSSAAAISYTHEKYEALLGQSFESCLEKTAEFLHIMSSFMRELETFFDYDETIDESLSYADFVLLPILRNLTIVKGMPFTQHLTKYIDYWCKKSKVGDHYLIAK